MTFLIHPDFSSQALAAQESISKIPEHQIQEQMKVPIAVIQMLPNGLKGALCIILLMGVFGGDGGHLHSWGSLLIQDVVVPLRKKPLTPTQHIRLLRGSMIGVAFFAFVFGSFFQQTEYIMMWWNVTMSLYVGGAGAAIIGGLYWKKGTPAGAWTAMITGSLFATGGILLRQMKGDSFPLNGNEISFYSTLLAIVLYIIVSLLTSKKDFNMDQMLHRNQYALETDLLTKKKFSEKTFTWSKIVGIDENFTYADKWVTGITSGLGMVWFVIFVIGTVWNLISPWSTETWSHFWYCMAIIMPIIFAVIGTVWFTWGGIRDMRSLFLRLKSEKVNVLDNGMVKNHKNLEEINPTSRY